MYIYEKQKFYFWWFVVKVYFIFIYFTSGRYIDCLSLTYATNKSNT